MTTHTPGPWHIENDGVWTLIRGRDPELGDDYPGPMVATTTNNGREEANAHLIKAAPDLLAALKQIAALPPVDGLDPFEANRRGQELRLNEQARSIARAAIAKAEGTS